MILGFKDKFPDGTPTNFREQILQGSKVHTMRLGARWKPGQCIQMATGVRTKNYCQFNRDRPDLSTVVSTQNFSFVELGGEMILVLMSKADHGLKGTPFLMTITEDEDLASAIALADGLPSGKALFDWFRKPWRNSESKQITGQIIHWTTFLY